MGKNAHRSRSLAWMREQFAFHMPILCAYCGVPCLNGERPHRRGYRLATVDHKVPLCRGGLDVDENFAVACAECNTDKGPMTSTSPSEATR